MLRWFSMQVFILAMLLSHKIFQLKNNEECPAILYPARKNYKFNAFSSLETKFEGPKVTYLRQVPPSTASKKGYYYQPRTPGLIPFLI